MNPGKYSTPDFLKQSLRFLNERPCPLCKGLHPIAVHDSRLRRYYLDPEGTNWIEIFRILCPDNKETRKKTGKRLQYTLTILPPFLIPYAKASFTGFFKAAEFLAAGKDPDLAVNEVSEEGDPRTLTLHLGRFVTGARKWIVRIAEWLAEQGEILPGADIRNLGEKGREEVQAWRDFRRAAGVLAVNRERSSPGEVIMEPEQPVFAHARLVYAGMGLGP